MQQIVRGQTFDQIGAAGNYGSDQAPSAFRLCFGAIGFRFNDFVDGVFQILRMDIYLVSGVWLCACVASIAYACTLHLRATYLEL